MKLNEQKCVPCDGGTSPLTKAEVLHYFKDLKKWNLSATELSKEFKFNTFMNAIAFINDIAKVAEKEGHHPDMCISYNRVVITLSTHAIKGLSINDFIIASKIDKLLTSA